MPQIADLEIAASWDEIELEAALRGASPESAGSPSAEVSSALADALRAVESLKQLPREERKRRAEELLRALTSTPLAPTLEPEAEALPPQPEEQTPVDASLSVESVVVPAEIAPPSSEERPSEALTSPEPVALLLDASTPPMTAEVPSAEPVAGEAVSLPP